MLRELLKSDFGKDLKISGGTGNSLGDLIILEPQSDYDASWTEMEVAKCVYSRLGWHWRAIGRSKIEETGKHVEKLSCEVKYTEGDQIVTEKRNFYFDLSNIDLGGRDVSPTCGFNLGANTGLGLPYQLGWFHFDYLINNEDTQAGMGVSVAYSAPTTKATVYVYNKEIADIKHTNEGQLEAEFASAKSELFSVYAHAKQIAEKFDDNLLFAAFDIDSAYSLITLSAVGNHFFKVRATLDPSTEKYTFDCLWESVNIILSMMKPKNCN